MKTFMEKHREQIARREEQLRAERRAKICGLVDAFVGCALIIAFIYAMCWVAYLYQ